MVMVMMTLTITTMMTMMTTRTTTTTMIMIVYLYLSVHLSVCRLWSRTVVAISDAPLRLSMLTTGRGRKEESIARLITASLSHGRDWF